MLVEALPEPFNLTTLKLYYASIIKTIKMKVTNLYDLDCTLGGGEPLPGELLRDINLLKFNIVLSMHLFLF